MAIADIAEDYITYESRLASFQSAVPQPKRRGSNASTKAPKALKWPHKWMSAKDLAKAGLFYHPSQNSTDNVACYLCHKNLDGWEDGDNPLVEHVKHSPDCGWAIGAMIESQDPEFSEENPSSSRMVAARKSTFAGRWPHENKKGWKCKIKQMVDAGWAYAPTPESDDMATCAYCTLALDGWENEDKPWDEHLKRSSDCAFFTLVESYKHTLKRTKSKKGRASQVSRLSTQSALTIASDNSIADSPAEEGDSILTTATNVTVTTQGGRKMGKAKKAPAAKGRKTKTKKDEVVEVDPAPEPEDDDFEVKVEVEQKPTRGRKRKSDESVGLPASVNDHPPPKRRATRTRGSTINNESMGPELIAHFLPVEEETKPVGRKRGRSSASRSKRKASAGSVASTRAPALNDEEIDAALEADLETRLTDDEAPLMLPKKGTRSSKVIRADHAMFGTSEMDVDEADIESELQAMEADSKPLPKAKGAKGKEPRKVSAKQQAAARKAAEAEAEAQRVAEEEASRQIVEELEHSLSIQHSSPIIQPNRQRASSRQPARQAPGRSTRASILTVDDSNIQMANEFQDALVEQRDDSGNETDASMASQSTVVRGRATRRGSTLKKGRGGKKTAIGRNIEEIVRKPTAIAAQRKNEDSPIPTIEEAEPAMNEDVTMQDERFFTPAPEALDLPGAIAEPAPKSSKAKPATKGRGRFGKIVAAPAPLAEDAVPVQEPIQPKSKIANEKEVAPRSPTPPPKDLTPVESPQSSDAENHPPSSKAPVSIRKPATPHANITRIPLAASTPMMSPSKRNIIAGLQSTQPWTAIDLDAVFMKSPGNENVPVLFGDVMAAKVQGGNLTSPERNMTVEEWIHYNAEMAEERLRSECERMVGTFEREGGRAMQALEGVQCID